MMDDEQHPEPYRVRVTRKAAGLALEQCATLFGYTVPQWRHFEDSAHGQHISLGEWRYLQLLAGHHPFYELKKRGAAGKGQAQPRDPGEGPPAS
jgi:hypothetical protein